jgi:predicted ribosomally synthesized peptide with nif11-like leader
MMIDDKNAAALRSKAEQAKSPEELLQMAQAEGITLTVKEAEDLFTRLDHNGALSDDELENVAGGGCSDEKKPKRPEMVSNCSYYAAREGYDIVVNESLCSYCTRCGAQCPRYE